MTTRFRFTTEMHLRRQEDFERAYESGFRAGDDHLLMFATPNGLPLTRLGRSVSRKHGTAVKRNRKRRRLREAFRLSQHEIPVGLDLVLVPRQREDSKVVNYQESIRKLAKRLAQQMARRDLNSKGPATS